MKDVVKALLFRILVMGLSFAVVLTLLSLFISIDKQLLGILIIAYTLPASYGVHTFGKFTDNEDYMSSLISCGTVISVVCAVIVSMFTV